MKRSTTLLALLLLLITACSKEKRIERRLHRAGKWNIELYEEKEYLNGELTETSSAENMGYFVFEKNGILAIYYNDGTSGTGQWSNTEDKIFIGSGGTAQALDIEESSRKKMLISYHDEFSDSTGVTFSYHLEREK